MALKDVIEATFATSRTYEIFIGGPVEECARICARYFADRGGCVSIDRTEFVYTGGREAGCVVRFINYPRFPKEGHALGVEAVELAQHLMVEMGQGSCSLQGPEQTVFLSRRAS